MSWLAEKTCYHCNATTCVFANLSACCQCHKRDYARCHLCCTRWDVNIVQHFLCRSCVRTAARKLPALLASFFSANSWGVTLPADLVRGLFMPLMYWNHPLPMDCVIRLPLVFAPVCFYCARYYPAASTRMVGPGQVCCGCSMSYVRCPDCTVPSPTVCIFCKTSTEVVYYI